MSAPRCILGVDPGISGAIAFYFPDYPERVAVEDMPVAAGEVDAVTLANRIRAMAPDVVFLERVGAMPGQGVSSTFKFGRAYGTAIIKLLREAVGQASETTTAHAQRKVLPFDLAGRDVLLGIA